MTYNKLTEQKERGQMLARLKVLYEMFGLEMPQNELSDFYRLCLNSYMLQSGEVTVVHKKV